MKFTTKSGRVLSLDTNKWTKTKSRVCKILGLEDDYYLLQNQQKNSARIHCGVIQDNDLTIVNNQIELTYGLYEYYFSRNQLELANKRFYDLFNQHIELILANRQIVLSKPEYYLLTPDYLTSGSMYTGGLNYSLGSLIESMESGGHIFYKELYGYENMYLICLRGSQLSGSFFASFYADKMQTIVNISSRKGYDLPDDFSMLLRKLLARVRNPEINIHFQEKALQLLLDDIHQNV